LEKHVFKVSEVFLQQNLVTLVKLKKLGERKHCALGAVLVALKKNIDTTKLLI
jgi:hypothetical protein